MKGMMVQEKATLEDALKKMEEGQMPGGQAPTLPPRVIGTSNTHAGIHMHEKIMVGPDKATWKLF